MTQTQHTPGPWVLKPGVHNRVKLIDDKNGNAIGEYVDCRKEANARLISAAPDMYEALINAEYQFAQMEHMFKDDADFINAHADIQKIIANIARQS